MPIKETTDQTVHRLNVQGRRPGRNFKVVSGGIEGIRFEGFGLDLLHVVAAELAVYPSPAEMEAEHGGEPWDLVIFEDDLVAAVILGRRGERPMVWHPNGTA